MSKVHEAVFENDIKCLSLLLRMEDQDINLKDKFGNTPLHLAIMLGRRECAQLLLARGAQAKAKNGSGWTVLCESLSYGDRQTIMSVYRKLKQQIREKSSKRRPSIVKALESIEDFTMVLKWDFHTWVPLLSQLLPSDVCNIRKKGARIRVDTTIGDVTDMKLSRGDLSFLFNLEASQRGRVYLLDHKTKTYKHLETQENEADVEDEVDELMRSDIVSSQMSTKSIRFERVQRGFFWKEDKREMIGCYEADFYSVQGLNIEVKRRQEHLTAEELTRNNALVESLNTGQTDMLEEFCREEPRKASLAPPPPCSMSYHEYLSSTTQPVLGRKHSLTTSIKSYKAVVAMAKSFPLSVESLLKILDAVAPVKHIQKLRQFVELRLPPGFPVKVDIPVLPTVSARVTFQDFRFSDDLDDATFEIPASYTLDSTRESR